MMKMMKMIIKWYDDENDEDDYKMIWKWWRWL